MLTATANAVWLITGDSSHWADIDRRRAATLDIPVVVNPPRSGLFIARNDDALTLHHGDAPRNDPGIRCALADFKTLSQRRAGGRQSPMAKAFGLHRHPPLSILDTTAGLARDAATLAALGCSVTAIERQPVLYALLADASQALDHVDAPPAWWPNWHTPIHDDAIRWLLDDDRTNVYDAIYIDPMFASPRRKSRPQKAMSWLAELAGTDNDAAELLNTARRYAGRRVVVKQHARAKPLAVPDLSMEGRAIRFDIYLAAS